MSFVKIFPGKREIGLVLLAVRRFCSNISCRTFSCALNFAFGLLLCTGLVQGQSGLVQLQNTTHQCTALEVGDTAGVFVAGTPNSTITVSNNGGGQTVTGSTNSAGTWNGMYLQTTSTTGSYNEQWFIGGKPLSAIAYNPTWCPFAPNLPQFTVYAKYSGLNCAQNSSANGGMCNGHSSSPKLWLTTPVNYEYTGNSFPGSYVTSAASGWNSLNTPIAFQNGNLNVTISEGSTPSKDVAITYSYGEDCNAECYDRVFVCTDYDPPEGGACSTGSVVDYVTITLNVNQITGEYSNSNFNPAVFVPMVIGHELGHSLRLGDIAGPLYGRCSEVQSLMYPSASVLYGCGVTAAEYCDASTLDNIYATPPLTCSYEGAKCYIDDVCQ
jgi:hypothetical protein